MFYRQIATAVVGASITSYLHLDAAEMIFDVYGLPVPSPTGEPVNARLIYSIYRMRIPEEGHSRTMTRMQE